jgi:prefoldin subunit 5
MPKTDASSMAVDLSKAYYSRDEVMRAIESLKDRYIKESTNAQGHLNLMESSSSSSKNPTSSNRLASSGIVKDIECLNNKLAELQSEISRLTLLQQKQHQANSSFSKYNNTSNTNKGLKESGSGEKMDSLNGDVQNQQQG